MLNERLTKSVVENVETGPKDIIIWDRDVKGFGQKVRPSGRSTIIAQAAAKGRVSLKVPAQEDLRADQLICFTPILLKLSSASFSGIAKGRNR